MDEEKKKYKTFEEMYLNTYKLVYVFIHDYTKDWDIAEEISSIIWMKIAEAPELYLKKDIRQFHNYLRVMVKNEIIQQHRRLERQEKAVEKISTLLHYPQTAEEEYVLLENLEQLEKARKNLSEEENRLLDLRFEKKCSVKETGEKLGISTSAVKMRQSRILTKLKRLIE